MDIAQIRKDTTHCNDLLFLNSAGASLMPKTVVEHIKNYLDEEEKWGGYKVFDIQKETIDGFYKATAKLINTKAHNIAFAHDATDAYITALSSISFEAGDVIITSENDYSSNQIQFLSLQKRFNIILKRIKTLENGDLDLLHFQQLIQKYPPKLVAITHVPTNSGMVQAVADIGKICHQQQIIYLVDACQSVGQFPVDVQKIKCDFLTTTGRKFLRGPRGTGFLYISDRLLNEGYSPLFVDGGSATWTKANEFELLIGAKRFQRWEKPYALIIGLKKAIEYANDWGMNKIQQRNQLLINRLRSNLASIPKVQLYDRGTHTCNILTFRKADYSMEQIQKILDQNKVIHGTSTKKWGLIDFEKKGVDWVIRLSPHYFNTLAEMDQVAEVIEHI